MADQHNPLPNSLPGSDCVTQCSRAEWSCTGQLQCSAVNPVDSVVQGLRSGSVLAVKFRIAKVIGRGGTGLIFAAHHTHLDQRVAIKVLRPDALRNKQDMSWPSTLRRSLLQIFKTYCADITSVVQPVIGRCLWNDPESRCANVAEFADALAPFAPRRAHVSVERIRGTVLQHGAATKFQRTLAGAGLYDSTIRQRAKASRRCVKRITAGHKWEWLAIVLVLAALGLALLAWRADRAQDSCLS